MAVKVTVWSSVAGLGKPVRVVVVLRKTVAVRSWANSEVFPRESVAVALMASCPEGHAARPDAVKVALPAPSVLTVVEPR